LIIIPNISAIAEKLGLETRSTLSIKAALEKKNTDIAKQANDSLIKVNEILSKTNENKIETITSVTNKIQDNNDKALSIIEKRKTKTDSIKNKSRVSPDKIEPKIKEAMDLTGESHESVENSEINALIMLEAYCEYNKDDNCKPLTKII
jgi:hypothetical protein